MLTLFHHPFCPHSRFVRLALGEYGLSSAAGRGAGLGAARGISRAQSRRAPRRCWSRRARRRCRGAGDHRRISRRDPRRCAGRATGCMPVDIGGRDRGAPADELVQRQILRRSQRSAGDGAHLQALHPAGAGRRRARRPRRDACGARAISRYHLAYIGWLVRTRDWLAGDRLSYADLAAAAHLSAADYLGDVPWDEDETAKSWYARVKSRPSFRPLLQRSCRDCRRRRATPISTSDAAGARRPRSSPRPRALGFDAVGVTRPDAIPLARRNGLRAFLAAGAHGDMDWMAAEAERRGDPRALWPQVRSIVMLGVNYGPDDDPLAILRDRDRGAHLGLCPRRRLSRRDQAAAQSAWRAG